MSKIKFPDGLTTTNKILLGTAIVIFVAIPILFAAFAFSGWIIMVVLGALSHMLNLPRLAIGFWPSVLISILIAALKPSNYSSKK